MATVPILQLIQRIRVVGSDDERSALIATLAAIQRPTVLSFINQHAFNLAYERADLRDGLMQSDYLLRDGVGLELAMKFLGLSAGLNCNGTDFIPLLLRTMSGRRLAVFGTREPWLSQAGTVMASYGLEICATADGFRSEELYLEQFQAMAPDIVLLAMGMPKQEILSIKLREAARKPCLIINGGAIVDFLGGRFPRASAAVQALRLEWLYRLALEPGRLAGRYVYGGGVFAYRVARLRNYVQANGAGPN